MYVASYQIHTTMLLNYTTLNKHICWNVLLHCVFICLTFADTQFSVSEFLKTHETEFFEVVNPRLTLLRLIRKGVITEDVKSNIDTSNTKDAREVLYHHLAHYATVDTLREYCEVAIDADGLPKMQSFGRKMKEELQQGRLSVCGRCSVGGWVSG